VLFLRVLALMRFPGTPLDIDSLFPGSLDVGRDGTSGTKKYSVRFDGVYMNSDVYLNGRLLGSHPYGYTTFE